MREGYWMPRLIGFLAALMVVLSTACSPTVPTAAPQPTAAQAPQTIVARAPEATPKPASATAAPTPAALEADLQDIKQRGELRVALTGTNIPFNMINKKGDMIGFDPDITQAIADKIGVKRTFEVSRFAGLIPNLTSAKVDLISAGMTINDERKQVVDVSDLSFHA